MKSVFFFPVVLSPVVLGAAFSQIYDFQFGYINEFLRAIGLGSLEQNWLGDPDIALYSVIAINIFQWTGSSMVMYYMAMLTIEKEIFDRWSWILPDTVEHRLPELERNDVHSVDSRSYRWSEDV